MWFNERWPWLIINSVDGVLKGSQWEQWIEWPRRSIIFRMHS
jgi:hypothetical protein